MAAAISAKVVVETVANCIEAGEFAYLDSFVHERTPATRWPESRILLCAGHLYVEHVTPSVVELLVNRIYCVFEASEGANGKRRVVTPNSSGRRQGAKFKREEAQMGLVAALY